MRGGTIAAEHQKGGSSGARVPKNRCQTPVPDALGTVDSNRLVGREGFEPST
jgi:hypothetical protein